MAEGTQITRDFVFEKSTKNTHKFEEQPPKGEPPVIGSLYLQKWAAGDVQKLTVTVNLG